VRRCPSRSWYSRPDPAQWLFACRKSRYHLTQGALAGDGRSGDRGRRPAALNEEPTRFSPRCSGITSIGIPQASSGKPRSRRVDALAGRPASKRMSAAWCTGRGGDRHYFSIVLGELCRSASPDGSRDGCPPDGCRSADSRPATTRSCACCRLDDLILTCLVRCRSAQAVPRRDPALIEEGRKWVVSRRAERAMVRNVFRLDDPRSPR